MTQPLGYDVQVPLYLRAWIQVQNGLPVDITLKSERVALWEKKISLGETQCEFSGLFLISSEKVQYNYDASLETYML